jgi:ferric-dicitrate binding protein FerR (iron transport regulator)
MDKKYSEIFLARWLSDELTEDEKNSFEASEDFLIYKKIAEKSSELVPPEFNKIKVFNSILDKTSNKSEVKVRKLFKPWMYSVAASILVLLGIFYFLNQPEKYVSGIGEQLAIILPDNSKVILNANSTLSFNKNNWNENRNLNLNGEAYFKVEKGSDFVVETKEGKVTVLGTQFNVKTDTDFFEVICYEGKVKAETNTLNTILIKGDAFRKMKDSLPEKWMISAVEPSWKKGESSFKSVPLEYVIKALKNQYKITIDASKIDVNKRFTGSFTHKNLQVALQTVFVPMKIDVTFKDEKTVLLQKQ